MRKLFSTLLFICLLNISYGYAGENVMIEIEIDGEKIDGVIYDNAAGKSFLNMLPLTLTLEDYNNTEKISYLKDIGKIDTKGMANSYNPKIGTIAFYKPWGNLCIFYKDFRLSSELYPIGEIKSDMEIFAKQTKYFKVTIKRK